ncbi:MAG: hypothetical protein ACREI7_13355 [Myxococcota bacterium]
MTGKRAQAAREARPRRGAALAVFNNPCREALAKHPSGLARARGAYAYINRTIREHEE